MGRAYKAADRSTYSGRVASRVRELRDKKGLTVEGLQAALAENGVEVGVPTIYAWENGNSRIDLDHIPALSAAFGLKVLKFLPPE